VSVNNKQHESQEEPEAAYYLGFMYMHGLGFVQDTSEAFTHFSVASNLGSMKAKCSLAFLYEHGTGCQKDLVKARMLYEQAAGGGHIGAQFGLAFLAISLDQYKDALI
jgi:TPR repeat protein